MILLSFELPAFVQVTRDYRYYLVTSLGILRHYSVLYCVNCTIMVSTAREPRLAATLGTLKSYGVVPGAVPLLDAGADAIGEELQTAILEEIPAFSASGNPDILPEQAHHASQHLQEIRRLMNGGRVGDFDFVREHARRRAAQKFPLEATLHAYRWGHKILSRWVRDAALASASPDAQVRRVVATIADFAIEYTDSISTIATSEYVTQTRLLAEAEGDRRTELLNVLLGGFDESDGRVARLLRQGGYLRQRQSYCVAVAQPIDPSEMQNPARAQRLADALKESVQQSAVRSIVGIRDNTVTAIFSMTRRHSGWTAPQSALAERLQPQLLQVGIAALIGVSSDVPSTSHIPKALEEATLALEFAGVANRVVQYTDIPVRRMMLRLSRESLRAALPAWADALQATDKRTRGVLNATLHAYAEANMNVLQAAKRLAVHPNTIYSRINKVQDVTGKNALVYHDLTELLLAMDCHGD